MFLREWAPLLPLTPDDFCSSCVKLIMHEKKKNQLELLPPSVIVRQRNLLQFTPSSDLFRAVMIAAVDVVVVVRCSWWRRRSRHCGRGRGGPGTCCR